MYFFSFFAFLGKLTFLHLKDSAIFPIVALLNLTKYSEMLSLICNQSVKALMGISTEFYSDKIDINFIDVNPKSLWPFSTFVNLVLKYYTNFDCSETLRKFPIKYGDLYICGRGVRKMLVQYWHRNHCCIWKTLIRLGGCPGWSESSLGAHATLLVLSWGGSFIFIQKDSFVFWSYKFELATSQNHSYFVISQLVLLKHPNCDTKSSFIFFFFFFFLFILLYFFLQRKTVFHSLMLQYYIGIF